MTEIKLPEPAFKITKSGRVFSHPDGVDCTGRALDVYTVDQLRAAVEEVQKDAARYRWLRDGGFFSLPYDDHGLGPEFPCREELDAAIDAAMKEEGHG